jgi:hypothetical protein
MSLVARQKRSNIGKLKKGSFQLPFLFSSIFIFAFVFFGLISRLDPQ